MTYRKLIKIALIAMISLGLLTNSLAAVLGETTIDGGDVSLTMNIYDAFYGDLDNDGVEDDAQANFTINIVKENGNQPVTFDLIIVLVLPSGRYFCYYYRINTAETEIDATMVFINQALEPGWYDVYIVCILYGEEIGFGIECYTFDPPGDDTGTDPPKGELTF
ncbi:MAG: hypothetical protein KAR35_03470 [Candidatus Heimdallarchaeota archaeon]|nr:hypothetical protein [Candidatus Heimdallarchaeota archaeon]MCK5048415.1 hypothetical protein [Candidatus Heimdallarchaeota archaeon]